MACFILREYNVNCTLSEVFWKFEWWEIIAMIDKHPQVKDLKEKREKEEEEREKNTLKFLGF
jgi:hypothetical protein